MVEPGRSISCQSCKVRRMRSEALTNMAEVGDRRLDDRQLVMAQGALVALCLKCSRNPMAKMGAGIIANLFPGPLADYWEGDDAPPLAQEPKGAVGW